MNSGLVQEGKSVQSGRLRKLIGSYLQVPISTLRWLPWFTTASSK